MNTIAGQVTWQANAFLMDKEEIEYSTIKPFPELLAIAYLRSIRARVTDIGLSYFASYSGGHRCLAAGDKVFMADGSWKNIEDMNIGDKVFSPQHDYHTTIAEVLSTTSYFEKEPYDVVRHEDAKTIYTCSRNHRIPLIDGNVYTAEDIAKMNNAITLQSKGVSFNLANSYKPVKISCLPASPQQVYGITINSPSHRFITNDRFVTCNSGKSLFAALSGTIWDHTFYPRFEQRIVQSPQEFVKAMEVIIEDEIKGAAIVIDEAGATMAASDWYERWLKLIQKTMQICGLLKPMILFVAPNREFIVSGMRKLIVGEYYMERGSPDYTFCTPYQVKYSTIKHDYYYRKPIVRINNMTVQMKRIKIFKPPQYFIDRYINITEPRKMDMIAKFGEEATSLTDASDTKIDYEQIVEQVFKNKELYFGPKTREGIPTIDQTTLEIQHELKPKMAKWVKGKVELRLAEALKEVAEIEELQQTKAGQKEMEQNIARDLIRRKTMKRAPVEEDVLSQLEKQREKEALEQADEELKSVLSEV